MERMDELALHYRCEYCLASPGVWCRTRIGAKATHLHSDRLDPLTLAFSDGYLQGAGAPAAMTVA